MRFSFPRQLFGKGFETLENIFLDKTVVPFLVRVICFFSRRYDRKRFIIIAFKKDRAAAQILTLAELYYISSLGFPWYISKVFGQSCQRVAKLKFCVFLIASQGNRLPHNWFSKRAWVVVIAELRARSPVAKKIWETHDGNAKNFGLVMTSRPSVGKCAIPQY